ncbi:MAG: formyltetrahydrofolate deformylase [Kofleriaceae bacterium]
MIAPLATFLVNAPDQPGLVARLAGFFAARGLNIVDASNHTEHAAAGARFFMRLVVDAVGLDDVAARAAFVASFDALVADLGGAVRAAWSDERPRVAILATKEPGCLYDLVLRQRAGELRCELPLILSNHELLAEAAASFQIPFVSLPVTAATKPAQERAVLELLREHKIELVVLARYMQVLSPEFIAAAPPVINIHHGFLPAFQGARPYHQAHARGVKLIGATAHYATAELDDGPIIEQDVARVSHAHGPEELVRLGRDVERVVLARAVRAHLDNRVVVEGRRTFVL